MIKNILIAICTFLLFACLAWTTIAATAAPAVTPVQIPQSSVDYTLPYPGILPDSPLYILKAFRDRIVSFFITDAKKQAEFDLLQADKRLAAGQYLLQESTPNDALISETISKGENYFQDAIVNSIQAKKEGVLMNDFFNTLARAGKKHEQVLFVMSQQTHGSLHRDLLGDIYRVQGFEKMVKKISTQP